MSRTDRQPRRRLDPAQRRAAILTAAGAAFGTAPYEEVTISAIARAAGASDALLYRYFNNKEELYAELVGQALDAAAADRETVLRELPAGSAIRDAVRAVILSYLDHLAGRGPLLPLGGTGAEPRAATELRAHAEVALIDQLRDLLNPSQQSRHEFALRGFLGFLDSAGRHWVRHGSPAELRHPLVDAALGSLEGALGDWAA